MQLSLQHAVAHLRGQGLVRRSLLGLAAFGAALAGLLSLPHDGWTWADAVHAAGLVLAAVIPLTFAITEKTAADLVHDLGAHEKDLAQLKRENEAVKSLYRRSIVLYETARAIAMAADAVQLAGSETREAIVHQQLLAILDRLVERKSALFDMNDDRWTFTIYQNQGGKLVARASRRWSRDGEGGPHREWASGDGHVGQAFKMRQEVVVSDARDANVAVFLAADIADRRSYDPELYVSFASVPIKMGDIEAPRGVLSATSDQAGRFVLEGRGLGDPAAPDTVEPLRVAARVIATIL